MEDGELLKAMKVAAPHKESCRSIKVLSAHKGSPMVNNKNGRTKKQSLVLGKEQERYLVKA